MIGYVWHRPAVTIPQVLEELGQLPPRGDLFWYAWNEHTLELPGILAQESLTKLNDDWDVCCVFSDDVEVRYRYFPREPSCWISCEDSSPVCQKMHDLAESQSDVSHPKAFQQFPVARKTLRILWGRKLHLAAGVTRGEVAFPRTLQYTLPDKDDLESAVAVDAFHYVDTVSGQSWIRYARLRLIPPSRWEEHLVEYVEF